MPPLKPQISGPTKVIPNILNSIVDSTLVEKLFDNQDSPIFNRAISGQYPHVPHVGGSKQELPTTRHAS